MAIEYTFTGVGLPGMPDRLKFCLIELLDPNLYRFGWLFAP